MLQEAVTVLQQGGVVAFPTETVYGLGADALNEEAVRKVFQAKGRPSDNPLIVHIAESANVSLVASEFPEKAQRLAGHFWPGPMTLVVKRNGRVPNIVTANLETVAVRVPNHPVTLALLKKFNGGIVGPSANTSGKPSPTTAQHVADDLDGKIDMILDAGATAIGVESTVIDVTVEPPMILRFGGLSREEIEKVIGTVQVAVKEESLRRSPGTRHRHYAPNAEVVLIEENNCAELDRRYHELLLQGKQVGVVTHSMIIPKSVPPIFCKAIGPSVQQFARQLFASLRELDELHADVILVERVAPSGLGAAIMDRLNKAAHFSKTPSK
ncbi:MAG TPA: L-threonylcarbamoyladenylate synthase [Bacteroidota bacterium]|nr:L-threonylcarbamoyladenylate synthase [Bacteroidota bacterium]